MIGDYIDGLAGRIAEEADKALIAMLEKHGVEKPYNATNLRRQGYQVECETSVFGLNRQIRYKLIQTKLVAEEVIKLDARLEM